MNHKLYTLLLLLPAALLPGCGTCFSVHAYNVGVSRPYLENTGSGKTKDWYNEPAETLRVPKQELYRLGSDYYVKLEVAYMTGKVVGATSSAPYWWTVDKWVQIVPKEDSPQVEKTRMYFRLFPWEVEDNGLPMLSYYPQLPVVLTEQEAQQYKPELVKRYGPHELLAREAVLELRPRYFGAHAAMLPVAGLAALVVDAPATIISSAATGIGTLLLLPFCIR